MTHSDLLGVLPHPDLLDSAPKGQVVPARGPSALRDASVHADTVAPRLEACLRQVAATGGFDLRGARTCAGISRATGLGRSDRADEVLQWVGCASSR
jgi:hypothetical protein